MRAGFYPQCGTGKYWALSLPKANLSLTQEPAGVIKHSKSQISIAKQITMTKFKNSFSHLILEFEICL
jgi:hypothetical protein